MPCILHSTNHRLHTCLLFLHRPLPSPFANNFAWQGNFLFLSRALLCRLVRFCAVAIQFASTANLASTPLDLPTTSIMSFVYGRSLRNHIRPSPYDWVQMERTRRDAAARSGHVGGSGSGRGLKGGTSEAPAAGSQAAAHRGSQWAPRRPGQRAAGSGSQSVFEEMARIFSDNSWLEFDV